MRPFAALLLLAVPGVALAGSAKQETDFYLSITADRVCDWIEHHPAEMERAAGAVVAAERGDQVKLEKSNEDGRYAFWVRRSAQRGRYREDLVQTVTGDLTHEQSIVEVAPNPSGGCIVTIRMSATVDSIGNVKIAVGCRRAIRGMRGLLEKTFGQPSDSE
jgi:hypothetical protein